MDIQAALEEDEEAAGAGGLSPVAAPTTRALTPLPPSAITALEPALLVQTPESRAIDKMSRVYGGRAGVEELLLGVDDAAPDSPASRVLALLLDPANDGRSLGLICKLAGVSFATLMRSINAGDGAEAIRASMHAIHRGAAAVTADIVRQARPHAVVCGACSGSGSIVITPARIAKGKIKRPTPEERAPCSSCRGTGEKLAPAQLEHQKLVLEIAGIHKKGAHSKGNQLILNQQLNQTVKVRSDAAVVLDSVKQAAAKVIYRQGEPVVDAQVITRVAAPPAAAAAPPPPPAPTPVIKPAWKR